MLLQVAGDERNGTLLLPILVLRGLALEEGDFQVVNAGSEFLVVHGLENVVRDLQPQGFPAIGKIIIARHDDKGGLRVLDAAELNDLQPVHNGDVDVHDGDIRIQGVDLRQGLHAVGGLAHHLAVVGLPVEEPLEALPDHDFIVYQKNTQFFHGASSSRGSRIWAVTPPDSFSVYHSPYSRPQSSLIRFWTLIMPMLLPVSLGACLA